MACMRSGVGPGRWVVRRLAVCVSSRIVGTRSHSLATLVLPRDTDRSRRQRNQLRFSLCVRSNASSSKGGDASDGTTSASKESSGVGASGGTRGASERESPAPKQALFALPLYRKPAFPGFYHIVQVGDQEIVDFLHTLRRNGQAEYLAGFMTRELPRGLVDDDGAAAVPLVAVPPTSPPSGTMEKSSSGDGPPQSLRRDTGRVKDSEELEEFGTLLQIVSLTTHPSLPGGQVVVMPSHRIQLMKALSKPSPGTPLCAVYVKNLPQVKVTEDNDVRALHHEIIATMKDLLKTPFIYKDQFEQVIKYYNLDDPLKLADLVAGMSTAPREELQAVLVENSAVDRLRKVLMIVKKDLEHSKMQSQFKTQIEDKFAKEHRRYVLMQHLRQIKRDLNLEKDDKQSVVAVFKEAMLKMTDLPEEANKAMEMEIKRLGNLEASSPEFNVSRSYLEWMTALPWGKFTVDNTDIGRAEEILNEDHYGMEDVKERILEHMAVSFLKGSVQGKILCMVGPPGVGKTSVGKGISRALDRQFFRFSVGGLHDVSEIRGHRRTYVGAMPGKIIQALKITQTSNPVILIDEVDKLGSDFRGDPASALLEILDPAQNGTFRDLYLDVPVDLSRVLFVCTANVTNTIPEPLLDRMEVIQIAGYIAEEKLEIANQYLIPNAIDSCGITREDLDLGKGAVQKLIIEYAREAGVRELRKLLEKIVRKTALNIVREGEEDRKRTVIAAENLVKYVGQPPFAADTMFADGMPPGVVRGLAWTALGGKTLFVEARGSVSREKGEGKGRGGSGARLKITGRLGKVMEESSEIALTFARIFMREVEPPNAFLEEASMHVNLPEGATPKDGPSAGITMTTSFLSMALNQPVRKDLAMTGELTLTGKVLRVGGIKEKTLACRRENVPMIVLPMSNKADFLELKSHLRAGLTAHFVDHYDDVYRLAFEDSGAPALHSSRGSPVVTHVTPLEEGQNTEESIPTLSPSALPAASQT